MKKVFALFLAAMLLACTACGGSAGSTGSTGTADPGDSVASGGSGNTSTPAGDETPRQGGEIVVGLSYEPDTMNVYSTHLLGDVQAMVVEGLLVPNSEMEYVPVLAKEVPTVENGGIVMDETAGTMDVTYHLRDDVQWHCGEKFTAADVVATWEALCDPNWEAESKDGASDIDSIEAPDDYTVICHYNTIIPDFAQTLFTFGIMPAHDIAGKDMNDPNNGYNNTPCGTGPYVFSEWVSGEYIKLTRNDNYYGDNGPYLDSVTVRFVVDENTRINMLKSGEIDFTYGISFANYDQVKDLPGCTAIVHGLNSWRYFDMNHNVPGLDDVNVRRAIACAIDKEALVNQLFSGIPQAWDQPWMPSDPFHVEGFKSEWSFDMDKANKLLDDAGWVMGSDGVRAKDGVRLEFTVICRSGTATDGFIAQVITSYLSQVGIKINTEEYASSTWSAKMYDGDYELGIGGYITSPGATRTKMYAIGGALNRGGWENQAFTDLCAKIDKELDAEARKAQVAEALTYFDSELPQIVIYANNEIIVVNEKLRGFSPNPTNMTNFCQSAGWWLAE